jgi:fumarate reductase subunit C
MKSYQRPMAGWWRRNPYYRWYMLREASCVFIALYALVVLTGLLRLYQGKSQFDAWRESLATPLSIAFHIAALVFVLYHSWTWFKVMPKTLPFIRLGAFRVPDRMIIAAGVSGAVAVSVLLFGVVWVYKP